MLQAMLQVIRNGITVDVPAQIEANERARPGSIDAYVFAFAGAEAPPAPAAPAEPPVLEVPPARPVIVRNGVSIEIPPEIEVAEAERPGALEAYVYAFAGDAPGDTTPGRAADAPASLPAVDLPPEA